MSHWTCTDDRRRLSRRDETLGCPQCGREIPCVEGIPVFGEPQGRAAPLVDELWELVQEGGADEAADRFCRNHGCVREGPAADWPAMIPVPQGGRVLEIGAGFGGATLELARQAAGVVALVPSTRNGLIVRERLESAAGCDVALGVVGDLRRLPLEDGTIDTIALEESAAAGFGLSASALGAAAAEWRRVLKPAGTVILGLGSRLHTAPGLERLASRVRSRAPESIDRVIRRAAGGTPARPLGLRRVVRTLAAQGFGPPAIFAPLPDPNRAKIIVPVEDAGVVRYCFGGLLRQNSTALRWTVRLVGVTARLGLVRTFAPYYFVLSELR